MLKPSIIYHILHCSLKELFVTNMILKVVREENAPADVGASQEEKQEEREEKPVANAKENEEKQEKECVDSVNKLNKINN